MEVPTLRNILSQHSTGKIKDTKCGQPWLAVWEEVASTASNMEPMNRI